MPDSRTSEQNSRKPLKELLVDFKTTLSKLELEALEEVEKIVQEETIREIEEKLKRM